MPKLDDLPVEVLAHVALFTNEGHSHIGVTGLRELLALRCASRCCRDAVRRAAARHRSVKHLFLDRNNSAQKIAAMGRVFGSGCRSLTFGSLNSKESVSALQDFVTSTNGRLRFLSHTGEFSPYFSMPELLELVRACPSLKTFYVSSAITANVEDFASAVGSACPLLDRVSFPCSGSPAEDYQWCFPRLRCLSFDRRTAVPGPIRWDKIKQTLRTCVHATMIDLMNATIMSQHLVDLILAAPVASRLTNLDLSETAVSPELILRFVGGLEALSDLRLHNDFDGGRAFYRSLVQARPTIVSLGLGFDNMLDNEDLRIICHGLRLEHLELMYVENLTHVAVDVILESPCAQTLRSIDLSYTAQIPSAEVLRLIRGCPELTTLEWDISDSGILTAIDDGPNVDEIDALLKSRGGKGFSDFDVFEEYGPWPRRD